MNMNDNDEFMLGWLEEEMPDIVEQDIDCLHIDAMNVSNTVLMDLDMPRHTLTIQSRPNKQEIKLLGATIYKW